ncbi:hypothetical protein EDB86DRAFT_3089646 [Lactarius hatsudake]|nr:hypothetical protein EDB86DRAFT_3089646 [Lactarius hatsudake]
MDQRSQRTDAESRWDTLDSWLDQLTALVQVLVGSESFKGNCKVNKGFLFLVSLGIVLIQKPDGFLRSQFILPVAKTYASFAEKSVLHPSLGPRNPPKGLYAMVLTAVERAMRAHMTGAFHAPGEFNHQITWNSMKDFYKILDQVHESHWAQALKFDDFDDTETPQSLGLSIAHYFVSYFVLHWLHEISYSPLSSPSSFDFACVSSSVVVSLSPFDLTDSARVTIVSYTFWLHSVPVPPNLYPPAPFSRLVLVSGSWLLSRLGVAKISFSLYSVKVREKIHTLYMASNTIYPRHNLRLVVQLCLQALRVVLSL